MPQGKGKIRLLQRLDHPSGPSGDAREHTVCEKAHPQHLGLCHEASSGTARHKGVSDKVKHAFKMFTTAPQFPHWQLWAWKFPGHAEKALFP